MAFRDETCAEVAFFQQAFEQFSQRHVRRLFEPGCGSGRLVIAMAKLGYQVTGLDQSQPMLDYTAGKLKRQGLSASLVCGDMVHIPLSAKFDAGFCTFNTFRHLTSETDAIEHLNGVANLLNDGGIYVLGFHCIPLDADPECTERWKASHGGTNVSVTLKVLNSDRRKRIENMRVSIKATKRSGEIHRIRTEFPLRLYTHRQAANLLRKVDDVFEIASVFDFDYDIDSPREVDDDLTDAVFVLRRRGR